MIDFISVDSIGLNTHGHLRKEFETYIENPKKYLSTKIKESGITPDFSTTIHKRLAPQIIYKSSIFNSWGKKSIYVLDKKIYEHLPKFTEIEKEKAQLSWFTYELVFDAPTNNYKLSLSKVIHTLYQPTLFEITKIEPGPMEQFIFQLQQKLDEVLEKNLDSTETLSDIIQ